MNGFFVRVSVQADKTARDVEGVAIAIHGVGLVDDARLLMTVAASLLLLSQFTRDADDSAGMYDRIATDTDVAYRVVSQCALQLRLSLQLEASCDLEKVAKVMASINRDALADTQPINRPIVPGRRD